MLKGMPMNKFRRFSTESALAFSTNKFGGFKPFGQGKKAFGVASLARLWLTKCAVVAVPEPGGN